MAMERRTIRGVLAVKGTGLHRGGPITLTLRPGSQGIVFIRDGVRIRATPDNIVDTRLNTTVGDGRLAVSTIEHLMSAFYGLSVTDCDIEVGGDEMPALDGSALPFFRLLKEAGTEPLGLTCAPITLAEPVRVGDDKAWVEAVPGEFGVTYEIDFPDPAIGAQRFSFAGSDYEGLIAPARTFGRMQDVEMMRSAGLALGGGLHNAVVVDHDRVLNPEGLRFPDEFVRHKVLDILGDLWTLQAPLEARVKAHRANHTLHIALARRIFSGMQGRG
jgi:UDP-3-O-[3-hydroxymyristoyl] N-acetylglucosamine deacetylase